MLFRSRKYKNEFTNCKLNESTENKFEYLIINNLYYRFTNLHQEFQLTYENKLEYLISKSGLTVDEFYRFSGMEKPHSFTNKILAMSYNPTVLSNQNGLFTKTTDLDKSIINTDKTLLISEIPLINIPRLKQNKIKKLTIY